jgi:succinate-acetate transporter protein
VGDILATHPGEAQEAPQGDTRIAAAVHHVADPALLGLAGFAMTTFALSVGNANIWGPGASAARALALVYGGGAHFLAGLWEFVGKNTVGALAFSSYGAFWISYYVFVKFVLPGVTSTDVQVAVGVFVLGCTIFTAYMTVAPLRVTGAVRLVFVLPAVTFVLLTIGVFQSGMNVTKWGGFVGIATAAAARYASFAGVLNTRYKKSILPTVPLAPR